MVVVKLAIRHYFVVRIFPNFQPHTHALVTINIATYNAIIQYTPQQKLQQNQLLRKKYMKIFTFFYFFQVLSTKNRLFLLKQSAARFFNIYNILLSCFAINKLLAYTFFLSSRNCVYTGNAFIKAKF